MRRLTGSPSGVGTVVQSEDWISPLPLSMSAASARLSASRRLRASSRRFRNPGRGSWADRPGLRCDRRGLWPDLPWPDSQARVKWMTWLAAWNVDAEADRSRRQDDHAEARLALESVDSRLSGLVATLGTDFRAAIDDGTGMPKCRCMRCFSTHCRSRNSVKTMTFRPASGSLRAA